MSTGPQVTIIRVIGIGWCCDGLMAVAVDLIDDQAPLRVFNLGLVAPALATMPTIPSPGLSKILS